MSILRPFLDKATSFFFLSIYFVPRLLPPSTLTPAILVSIHDFFHFGVVNSHLSTFPPSRMARKDMTPRPLSASQKLKKKITLYYSSSSSVPLQGVRRSTIIDLALAHCSYRTLWKKKKPEPLHPTNFTSTQLGLHTYHTAPPLQNDQF